MTYWQKLPTNSDRILSDIKYTERESALLKHNKEKKEILPFVTQYQPSVSTLKTNRYFAKYPYKKGKSLKDMLVSAKL